MKKVLLVFVAAALVVTGCKKENEKTAVAAEETKTRGCYDRTKGDKAFSIPETFTNVLFNNNENLVAELGKLRPSQVEIVLAKNASRTRCDEVLQAFCEKIHCLDGDKAFYEYLQRRHTDYATHGYRAARLSWDEVMDAFKTTPPIECYDGWLNVTYDGSASPNTVSFSRSNVFDPNRTLYSKPFFQGIALKLKKPKFVSFSNGVCTVLVNGAYNDVEKVIFCVEYEDAAGAMQTEYYDMSDYPM